MKRVCITYHMSKPHESAETCATLPMEDEIADSILAREYASPHFDEVFKVLASMATLQGYTLDGIVCFEEVRS